MSTVSGVFPNAITPSFASSNDPAEQSRLRRENETAVFSPVEEPEKTTSSRRPPVEQPGRLEAESYISIATQKKSDQAAVAAEPSASEGRESQQATGDSEQARIDAQVEQQQKKAKAEDAKLQADLDTIRELAARDREVKAHEQAHQTVGGQYAGAMEFSYTQGPDGKRYATAGEVGISVGPVPNDPEATLRKADQVRRAALAPAEPSAQDRQVAAMATQLSIEAQNDIRLMERQVAEQAEAERSEQQEIKSEDTTKVEASSQTDDERNEEVSNSNKERLNEIFSKTSETVESALDAAYQVNRQQEVGFNLDTRV
ncbi:putative metalloprotease CJM1_0395 family protein [Reinekea sp.]|jgi:hypothetical protein|uniref:putative metalloprotease CJM1_0395 family protein n=1 Tax=Reinekea sp. TaxID=1970455 RepID=UPI0039892A04